ncbi:MAG: STAS domain-containing protein [Candidatus Zixiibacteriota bacterium]
MADTSLSVTPLSDESLIIATGTMLDNANAPEMLDAIAKAAGTGYKRIIVEMGNLEFLSSAGVGSILGSVEAVRESGGDVILCGLSPTIKHVLDVLDLSSFLTITADRQSALNVNLSGGRER